MSKISEDLDLLLNATVENCDIDAAICKHCAFLKHGDDSCDFCWYDDLIVIRNRIKALEERMAWS